jgi:photosystem II stability/assembly factor-like uncharacterized protein
MWYCVLSCLVLSSLVTSHDISKVWRTSFSELNTPYAAQDGKTPIMHAGGQGHASVVTVLLDRGADINKSDNVRQTGIATSWTRVTAVMDIDIDINIDSDIESILVSIWRLLCSAQCAIAWHPWHKTIAPHRSKWSDVTWHHIAVHHTTLHFIPKT